MTISQRRKFRSFLESRGALTLFNGYLRDIGYNEKDFETYIKEVEPLMAVRYAFPWDKFTKIINWEKVNDEWENICIIKGYHNLSGDVKKALKELFKDKQNRLKKCPKCGLYKDESQFYKRGENGLQSHCIDCCKAHGRLRNGTTGIYREEEVINDKKEKDMEDFTFFDFAPATGQGRKLEENTFGVNNKLGNRYVTFSKNKSNEIIDGEFDHLRVREDNITGDLCFVFTKNTGLPFNYKNKKSIIINSKQLVDFLSSKMGVNLGENKVFKLSENMAKTNDFLTYKILK